MPELQLCPLKCQSCGVAMHLNYPKVLNNRLLTGRERQSLPKKQRKSVAIRTCSHWLESRAKWFDLWRASPCANPQSWLAWRQMKAELKYVVSICQQRDLAVLCGHSLVVHSYTVIPWQWLCSLQSILWLWKLHQPFNWFQLIQHSSRSVAALQSVGHPQWSQWQYQTDQLAQKARCTSETKGWNGRPSLPAGGTGGTAGNRWEWKKMKHQLRSDSRSLWKNTETMTI